MSGGEAAAAMMYAIAEATKASGVIIRMAERDFTSIVSRMESPLVVYAKGGFLASGHQYLTSYKGLAFYTKSSAPVALPASAELVKAAKIWIPG